MRRAALSFILLAACGNAALLPGESQSFDAHDQLVVETTTGRVEVVAHDADSIDIEVLPGNGNDTWSAEEGADTLTVEARCSDDSVGCGVGFIISVPADTDLELDATTGELAVKGALTGTIDMQTTSGDIVGIDLSSATLAVLTNGQADVAFADRPADVQLDGGAGNLTLEVPAGSYDLQLEGAGDDNVDVEVTDDDSSERLYLEAAGTKTVLAGS